MSMCTRIKSIQFGVLSPSEIDRLSVVKVNNIEMYDGDIPKTGGLFDPRMGTLDQRMICPTDEKNALETPGYFGHLDLALPVLHYQYIKWLEKILRTVCPLCSTLRFNVNKKNINYAITNKEYLYNVKHGVRLSRAIELAGKTKHCDKCGNMQPKIVKKDKNLIHCLNFEYKLDKANVTDSAKKIVRLPPEEIYMILKGITDEDCYHIGLNPKHCRPEWLICSKLLVSPPSMRPPARQNGNLPMHDDLTYKWCDIIKANKALANYLEKCENTDDKNTMTAIDCYRRILQYHCAVLVDNTIQGLPQAQQRSGRPLKCIKTRLKAKEGRIRGNLNGKRVDHSARSVITPDPNLSINELGVPIKIAQKMTFPQKVTKFNKEKLQQLVKNGAHNYPGCNKLELLRNGKTRIYAMTIPIANENRNKFAKDLKLGDIVHRHLLDGDMVLFNRQPSLHRMSMMGHKIKVLPFDTFRLNVNVTTPYNADFDGDEMNMHVPQSISASVELKEIASVDRQIISPGTNKPVISLVQDSLLGFTLLSHTKEINRNEIMDILMWCGGEYNGKDIKEENGINIIKKFIIPKWNNKINTYKTLKNNSKIEGESLKGVMKNIIQETFNDYGKDETRKLLDNISFTANRWLIPNGFSVGLSDLFIDDDTITKMNDTLKESKKKVLKIICDVHKGTFKNEFNHSNMEEFESQIKKELGAALDNVGDTAMKSTTIENNRLIKMIKAGSKGKAFNFTQMISMAGQQSLNGQRVEYGFTDRSLPHFHKFDDGMKARGFVSKSYAEGLEPTEFFFHAMAGREGLIDTAVKTAETGYIQRRMVKAMEDLVIEEDGTVRNNKGNIVQLLYGGDGFNVTSLEKIKLHNKDVYLPINIKRMAILIMSTSTNKTPFASNKNIIDTRNKLKNRLKILGNKGWLKYINLNENLINAIDQYITPEQLPDNISIHNLTELYDQIIKNLYESRVSPGEPVGIISAQSLGEPATQMTLNTFHSAGVGKTSGVPRLREILRATKNMRSPSLTIYSKYETNYTGKWNENTEKRQANLLKLKNKILQVPLSSIISRTEIVYEPANSTITDTKFSEVYNLFSSIITDDNNTTKRAEWILNIVFNKSKMDNVEMIDVYTAIMDLLFSVYGTTENISKIDYFPLTVMYSDNNDPDQIAMRLILRMDIEEEEIEQGEKEEGTSNADEDALLILQKLEYDIIHKINIGGITGIKNVHIPEEPTESNPKYILETTGTNLCNILSLPEINFNNTVSNNIHEVLTTLGIDAARNTIVNELFDVIKGAGSYVNKHHIKLLADNMTRPGYFISVDRHGINKSEDNSIISRASFEKTPETLLEAAVFGLSDNMEGLSANVIFGQPIKLGTNKCELIAKELENPPRQAKNIFKYKKGLFNQIKFA